MVKVGVKQLRHCLRFAETFDDYDIVSALWRQIIDNKKEYNE